MPKCPFQIVGIVFFVGDELPRRRSNSYFNQSPINQDVLLERKVTANLFLNLGRITRLKSHLIDSSGPLIDVPFTQHLCTS